ncbi:hypothetical protein F2981_31525 (plasmid) [Sinorhizobium meliloti]|nr:hypothetical protein [Sinorhizobium meliloti]
METATQSAKLNLVVSIGQRPQSSDNVYQNAAYQNDATNWRFGFKQCENDAQPVACRYAILPGRSDISLTRWVYDDAMNVSTRGAWDEAPAGLS